jgi:hypothetical protein
MYTDAHPAIESSISQKFSTRKFRGDVIEFVMSAKPKLCSPKNYPYSICKGAFEMSAIDNHVCHAGGFLEQGKQEDCPICKLYRANLKYFHDIFPHTGEVSITIEQLRDMLDKAVVAGRGDCLIYIDRIMSDGDSQYFSVDGVYHWTPDEANTDHLHLIMSEKIVAG